MIKQHTNETRKRISESHKGKKQTDLHRKRIGDALRGKPKSKEHCKKISESHKGKPPSELTLQKLSKSRMGKKRSEATRYKMKVSHKGMLGKTHTIDTRKKISDKLKGEKHPFFGKRGKDAPNFGNCGAKSPLWIDGRSFLPYCFLFNLKRKIAVRVFFRYVCICCGKHTNENLTKSGKQRELSIHHVDHDKQQGCNGIPFNLVPLCLECHGKELYKEQEYKKYINKTLKEGFKWGIWSKKQYEIEVMYQ
jgi:hypothetical protein